MGFVNTLIKSMMNKVVALVMTQRMSLYIPKATMNVHILVVVLEKLKMKKLKGIKEKGEGKDKKKGNKFCRAFLKLYKKQGCDEKSVFDNSLTDKTGINSESFFKCAKSACCRNSTFDEDSCKQFSEEYWKNIKEKKASKSKDGKKGGD